MPSLAICIVHTAQVLQFSFCVATDFFVGSFWIQALPAAFQIALSTLMCLLIAIRTIKESIQIYKTTKYLQLNHYMKHIVREGMIYILYCVCMFIRFLPFSFRTTTLTRRCHG